MLRNYTAVSRSFFTEDSSTNFSATKQKFQLESAIPHELRKPSQKKPKGKNEIRTCCGLKIGKAPISAWFGVRGLHGRRGGSDEGLEDTEAP